VGDLLYVKESAWMWCERVPNGKTKTGRDKWLYEALHYAPVHYAADLPNKPTAPIGNPKSSNQWGWRLKIGRFLPKRSSRITLKITAIRQERLNDISEADAIAEGVQCDSSIDYRRAQTTDGAVLHSHAVDMFKSLWESLYGDGSWDVNPLVWVISFERVTE
jgi:hypothetical protein